MEEMRSGEVLPSMARLVSGAISRPCKVSWVGARRQRVNRWSQVVRTVRYWW